MNCDTALNMRFVQVFAFGSVSSGSIDRNTKKRYGSLHIMLCVIQLALYVTCFMKKLKIFRSETKDKNLRLLQW